MAEATLGAEALMQRTIVNQTRTPGSLKTAQVKFDAATQATVFRESARAARKRLADVKPLLDKGDGECHAAAQEAGGGVTRRDPTK